MKTLLTAGVLLAAAWGANAASADSETGGWPLNFTGQNLLGAVADEDCLYLGTANGTVYAVDQETGKTRWSQKLAVYRMRPLALADGRLFLSEYGNTAAINVDTSNIDWEVDNFGCSLVRSAGGQLFARSDDTLLRLNPASGQIEQVFRGRGYIMDFAPAGNGLVVARYDQFLDEQPQMDSSLSMIHPETGEESVWTQTFPHQLIGHIACDEERVYAGTSEPGLQAYNLSDGTPAWHVQPDIDGADFNPNHSGVYWPGDTLLWRDRVICTFSGTAKEWPQALRASSVEYRTSEAYLLVAAEAATGRVLWQQCIPRRPVDMQVVDGKLMVPSVMGWVRIIDLEDGSVTHTFELPYGSEIGVESSLNFALVREGVLFAGTDSWVWRVAWDDLLANTDWRGVIDYHQAALSAEGLLTSSSNPITLFGPHTEFEAMHAEAEFGRSIKVKNVLYEFYRNGKKVYEQRQFRDGWEERDLKSAGISLYFGGLDYKPDYHNSETFNLLMAHKRAAQGVDELELYTVFRNHSYGPSFTGGASLSYARDQLDLSQGYAASSFSEPKWEDGKLPWMVLLTNKPDKRVNLHWLRTQARTLKSFQDAYPEGDYLLVSILGEVEDQ